MAAKRLDIHPDALEEMKSALVWYLNRSETAAINFVSEFDHAVHLIVNAPDRWPRSAHATRKFVLKRFPFAIVYRETETTVQVLAVAHGHRRPGYWKKRL
jgi:plasmid stabilization system protein ParE